MKDEGKQQRRAAGRRKLRVEPNDVMGLGWVQYSVPDLYIYRYKKFLRDAINTSIYTLQLGGDTMRFYLFMDIRD